MKFVGLIFQRTHPKSRHSHALFSLMDPYQCLASFFNMNNTRITLSRSLSSIKSRMVSIELNHSSALSGSVDPKKLCESHPSKMLV